MLIKLTVLLTVLVYSESVYLYSSFWAPLYDRRVLNYRVEAPFDPDIAKTTGREKYAKDYGYRGEQLITDLGNGKGPGVPTRDVNMYGDVKFYYT